MTVVFVRIAGELASSEPCRGNSTTCTKRRDGRARGRGLGEGAIRYGRNEVMCVQTETVAAQPLAGLLTILTPCLLQLNSIVCTVGLLSKFELIYCLVYSGSMIPRTCAGCFPRGGKTNSQQQHCSCCILVARTSAVQAFRTGMLITHESDR
jgi:hypothetical protein